MMSLAIIKDSCFINLVLLVLEPNKCFNGFTIVIVGCVSLLLVLSPSCVNATMFGCLTNRKHWVTKAKENAYLCQGPTSAILLMSSMIQNCFKIP